MIEPVRFPSILHISWSESDSDHEDDFINERHSVIVTEKMDGENFTLTRNFFHARSPDRSGSYLSDPVYSWIKTLWGRIRYDIPENMRIIGEYVAVTHSLYYDSLPDYFLVFCIVDRIRSYDYVLTWNRTVEICDLLELYTVPVLYTGRYNDSICQEIFKTHPSKYQPQGIKEGIVVKTDTNFEYTSQDVRLCMSKAVRKDHVQKSEKHWRNKKGTFNGLAGRHV